MRRGFSTHRSTTLLRRVGTSALITAAAFGLTAALGVSAASAESKPCGYSESDGYAWYNHCTGDGSYIWIRYDMVAAPDAEQCVGPGLNKIGPSSIYRGAYYTGDLC